MLIEYRIEIKNGGVTITHRVEPDGFNVVTGKPLVKPRESQTNQDEMSVHQLGESFGGRETATTSSTRKPPKPGGGPHESADPGGGGPPSGMVIVLGPVVVSPSNRPGSGGGPHESADPGGGPHESADPGAVGRN
jgi:hypothetical protein